jgi:hypothetical protein
MLSFHVEGDRVRNYPCLLTINMDRARVIHPDETLTLRRTIDIGPLRRVSRGTPQQLQRVSVSVIVDPVQDPNGQWRPAATGQQLRPAYFSRLPAHVGPTDMAAAFAAVNGELDSDRFRALELLAELLGERQRAALDKLSYKPEPVPADRIYQALLTALRSESWEVRARALEALQVVGLDGQMLSAVQACLKHDHWCVRLMALRLIARQGSAASAAVKQIADDDMDDLVSDLAKSYVQMWEAAATQPATDGR